MGLSVSGTSAGAYLTVRGGLEAYGGGLTEKDEIVALNKVDAIGDAELQERVAALEAAARQRPLLISAVSGQGVKEALFALTRKIGLSKEAAEEGKKEPWRP